MDKESKGIFQAYADGINDYVSGVSLMDEESTGRILPPEFLVFGITKETWIPWHPTDSISIGRMVAIRFNGNWNKDLFKETMR